MSSSQAQPIPKSPPERTLLVAITVLIAVAVVQIVAVGFALAPRIDFEKFAHSLAPHPTDASAPVATAPAEVSASDRSQANEFLDDAQKNRLKVDAQGRPAPDFPAALEDVKEADRLMPNNAGILIQMAHDLNQLHKNEELVAVLKRIVALPPSADQDETAARQDAQAALAQIDAAGGVPAEAGAAPASATTAPAAPPKDSAGARDDVGIPIGSVMGIVDVKFLDAETGSKNLQVATKGASGQKIDPSKFEARVDFYEQNDQGEVIHNDSPRPNEWLSGPAIDWANSSPEIFQVKYRLPLQDRGDIPPLQYYGYVVAIYYNGELQDQRADPPALLNQFAPPLHKDAPAE